MTDATTSLADRPAWVDLAAPDPAAAREFYGRLFGWDIQVSPDPQYGGYARAKLGGEDVAGIGPAMTPGAPPTWNLYIGTEDAEELGRKVTAAGGSVVMPAFDVGDQGRMAVFRDPAGAFISAWQPRTMGGFRTGMANAFGWPELSARGFEAVIPFYEQVFGWTHRTSAMPDGTAYTEFLRDGESTAGGLEMSSMVPAEVPSYWLLYFDVDDVDEAFARTLELGGREMVSPIDFPGGRFAIVADPQGAAFGLLRTTPAG